MEFQVEKNFKKTNLPSGHVDNGMKAPLRGNTWADDGKWSIGYAYLGELSEHIVPEKPDKTTRGVTYSFEGPCFKALPAELPSENGYIT